MFFITFAARLNLCAATSQRGLSGSAEKQQNSTMSGSDTANERIRQLRNT